MNLQIVGCSHHRSNISIRERLAFSPLQATQFLEEFYLAYPRSEAVLLSTCNRTEFYTAGDPGLTPSPGEMKSILASNCGVPHDELSEFLFEHSAESAIQHLFSVAASLDSMVIGEPQILNQVKQAYRHATEFNRSMPLTHQAFQSAIRVAKRVANETALHSNRVSIPSIAVGVFAKQIFERLDNKRILVIGAGKMAEETLTYVQEGGGKDIVVINRTLETAHELAEKFGGRVSPWSELEQQLVEADLIVSTTGATQPIVTQESYLPIEKQRDQRPLFVLDLAVPRDFDAAIGDCLNVYLYSIDDLRRECDRNRQARNEQWPVAQEIVLQETVLFMNGVRHRQKGPTIARLKSQALDVKNAELDRLLNRIGPIDAEQQQEIETSFHRLVNKILHPPLESLKDESESGSAGLLDALKRLFQLGD